MRHNSEACSVRRVLGVTFARYGLSEERTHGRFSHEQWDGINSYR